MKKEKNEVAEKTETPPETVESQIRFDDYCTIRQILPRHRAGRRVFAEKRNVAMATLAEWDALFENY